MNLEFTKKFSPQVKTQIEEYLAGERKTFNTDIEIEGTEFQKKVWRALSDIPYGETRTYKQIAESIGHPKACRAVGTACGANKFPIVIPCHRAVASSGLGGFIFGLELKQELLDLEQPVLRNS